MHVTPLASSGLALAASLFCLFWAVVILLAGRGRTAGWLAAAAAAAALWLGAVAAFPAQPLDGP
ncbi:hypothetical protein, partial [Elioraea rosea]|uniref:hypothetical protein n=1 Tax=Elioraea rosea TaxID=2492390 RepID=UPI00118714EE